MKILNEVIPYRMRRMIPALAGAALMMVGCKKDDTPTPDTKPLEIELYFSSGYAGGPGYDAVKPDSLSKTLQKYANDCIIYLVPVTRWDNYGESSIQNLRQKFLEPALNMSPKFRGRGDFNFEPGAASKVPQDSLWYVKNGWTINKYLKD